MFDCGQMYEQVTGKKLREGLVFTVWLMAAYPEIVKPGACKERRARVAREGFPTDKASLKQFLDYDWPNTD